MSTSHGGPVTLKPISEIAAYIMKLIPADIPDTYDLKPRFGDVADHEQIRSGVIAYRDFLYLFFDRLNSDGDSYVKLPNKPKSATDYPFLYHTADLLADIGYYGKLAESGDSLLVTVLPSFIAGTDEAGNKTKPKNPASRLMDCLRFLAFCGFVFDGIDLEAKKLAVSEGPLFVVTYPSAPLLPAGLKAMAIADIELRTKRYKSDNNHDNLLRCDYRLLKAKEIDVMDILQDFLHPLPEKVRKFALDLHRHHIEMGMTCITLISTFEYHFAYAYVKNSRRVLSERDIYQQRTWEFALSPKHGYCMAVRAKKAEKYADAVERFPSPLKDKIIKGYGCDRKRNEPCQGGCQGILLPLDDSILPISKAVESWLDYEISC